MRKNLIFALCIVAVAGVLAAVLYTNRVGGSTVRVSIADHDSFTLPLQQDKRYTFDTAQTGALLPFSLEVQDKRVRFVNSQCPDHVCEGFGWLQHEYDEALCLPAGVVVRVETGA